MRRLLYLCLSIVMFSMIALLIRIGITVIWPSMISAGVFKYSLFTLFLLICLLLPIIVGGYFMAHAIEPNAPKARIWLRDSAIALIALLYGVGLFSVFETLVPPPEGYGTPTLIWFFAGYMIFSMGIILALRLLKYLKSRSTART